MNLLDALSASREDFDKEFEERNGFNDIFCHNHPVLDDEEYWDYISVGSDSLINEDSNIVENIL